MPPAGSSNPPAAGNILIVDDDLGLIRLIEKSLRREGFGTASVTSGKKAGVWLEQHRPDLMLLDLNLPDVPGQDLIHQLAAGGTAVPFIVITGHSDVHVAVDMMRQGAVDYLVKDRQFLELVPTVVQRAMAQLEQKKRLAAAEQALRVSEERFRVALKNSPITVFNQDQELRYTWIHHSRIEQLGETVVGKKNEDLFRPEEAARLTAIQRRVLTTGVGSRDEIQCTIGEQTLAYDLTVEPVRDAGGQILGVTCAATDITERKHAERRQRVQHATTLALAEAGTLAEAAPKVVQAVCEALGWAYGEFWGVDQDAHVLRYVEGWHPPGVAFPEFEAFSRQITFAPGVGLTGRVWARGETIWVPDVSQSPRFTRARVAAEAGLRGTCALPIFLGGEVLGVMVFFSRSIREPDRDLLQVFAAIGSQFGQFIERKRAEEALKKEHAFISAVLDTSGALVVVLDREGRIVRFNRACEQTTGCSSEEVNGKFFWDLFVTPEETKGVKNIFQKLAAGNFPSQHENYWRTRAGQLRSITWSNTILTGKDGRVEYVIGTGIDTTERRQAELALRRSEASLLKAQQIAHLGSYELSLSPAAADYWSEEMFRIAGREPALGVLSRDDYIQQVVHPEDRGSVAEATERAAKEGKLYEGEYRLVRPDGTIRHVQAIGEPVCDGRGEVVKLVGTLLDITDRKRLEKEISQISELERRRIGQDLHDGLCQHLAGIEFMSQVLHQRLAAKSKSEAAGAADIAKLVREAISHTRDLARGLSPVVLESEGLMSALQELADSTTKLFHVTCRFHCDVPVLIHDNAVATHLYRMAQEAVNNAIKHGQARRIDISLTASIGQVILAVTDNGAGMAKDRARPGGMGLRIMNYRAGMIGGSLTIQQPPEGGTRVLCTIKKLPAPSDTPTTYDSQKERTSR